VTTFIIIEAKLDPKRLEGEFDDRKKEIQASLSESLLDWGFQLLEFRVVGDGKE